MEIDPVLYSVNVQRQVSRSQQTPTDSNVLIEQLPYMHWKTRTESRKL
jgi:hypothetical protein